MNFLIFMIIWDRERHLSVFSIHSGIQKAMLLQTRHRHREVLPHDVIAGVTDEDADEDLPTQALVSRVDLTFR